MARFLGLLVPLALWAGAAAASPATDYVLEEAGRRCLAAGGTSLQFTAEPVVTVELTGDQVPEQIVDGSTFDCLGAPAAFHSTGGYPITIVVDGTAQQVTARNWLIIGWERQPVLLLDVHGSECGGVNARRCVRAVVWSEGALRSIGWE